MAAVPRRSRLSGEGTFLLLSVVLVACVDAGRAASGKPETARTELAPTRGYPSAVPASAAPAASTPHPPSIASEARQPIDAACAALGRRVDEATARSSASHDSSPRGPTLRCSQPNDGLPSCAVYNPQGNRIRGPWKGFGAQAPSGVMAVGDFRTLTLHRTESVSRVLLRQDDEPPIYPLVPHFIDEHLLVIVTKGMSYEVTVAIEDPEAKPPRRFCTRSRSFRRASDGGFTEESEGWQPSTGPFHAAP